MTVAGPAGPGVSVQVEGHGGEEASASGHVAVVGAKRRLDQRERDQTRDLASEVLRCEIKDI